MKTLRRTLRRLAPWALLVAVTTACGAAPKPMDTDDIRRRADDASRDLDHETRKSEAR